MHSPLAFRPQAKAACRQQQQPRPVVCSAVLSSRVAFGSWHTSHGSCLTSLQQSLPQPRHTTGIPRRAVTTMMGNKAVGGPFAGLVEITRNIIGEKDFNKLRGKAISLHSQIIKDVCKQIGVENRQVQGVIRLAKKNGERLGFLA